MNRDQAYNLMTEMLQNKNLQKHNLAVEAIMRALARELVIKHREFDKSEFDEEEWGIVGLLHDADYEITGKDLSRHTLVTEDKIKPLGASERIINGIKAHSEAIKPERENYLEKAVYTCDELSGLITAAALVTPDKKLDGLTVDSVLKRFKEKTFAAGAHRHQILLCETELEIPLPEFVKISLEAMKKIAPQLGL